MRRTYGKLVGLIPLLPGFARGEGPGLNPRLVKLSPGRWVKVHEQKKGDAVQFRRQAHGGSCFDAKRGRLVLFGSDTHGRNWENGPLRFDVARERWTRAYPHDPRSTYAVSADGIGVAGKGGERPWAMHTFGAVLLDPARDEMLIASWPGHMVPGRFTNSMKDLWPKVTRFPTWALDLKTGRWRPLPCKPVHFFPYCAAVDSHRNVVLGYRPDGIYELSGRPREWKRLTKRVFLGGWHNNCVYDAGRRALVVFGNNKNRNDVEVFFPAAGSHRLMPTPGRRPPKDQHNPMAYEPRIARTVVLVDRPAAGASPKPNAVAETWLYDLATDSWTPVPTATLPFGLGMNYNMEYDPNHRCLLLVTGGRTEEGPTSVWALRLEAGGA